MKKNHLITAIIAFVVSIATYGTVQYFAPDNEQTVKIEHVNSAPGAKALYTKNNDGDIVPLDFTKVAAQVTDAVVHIKSSQKVQNPFGQNPQYRSPFDDFFRDFFGPPQGQRQRPQQPQRPQYRVGTGSGVVISTDGYIVTNNHVIDNADDIEVTLSDNRNLKATVIGTDPSTDLALLKIEGNDLSTLQFVDSDQVQVGEWVMAVGNPFNLTSTVTAGIVSAKGRNINILQEQYAVESFIQTDAAINPGNSGGALVNLRGELIGINTAIASPTGAYSGYGFAVPTNIVRKVIEDLRDYGVVQRGVLGVMIRTVDGNLSKDKDLDVTNGVYVDSLMENSAAGAAGIQPGDVIIAVDGQAVETSPELQEAIAQRRPGDEVQVTVNRSGKAKTFAVVLNNREGSTALVEKPKVDAFARLGANFENLDKATARKLDLKGGVRVSKLMPGILRSQTQMAEGFIITKVDGRTICP
jgi:serine protease Do